MTLHAQIICHFLQPRQPSPALVHLYDPNSLASTTALLRDLIVLPTIIVEIDPLVCPTPRSLFTHIWSSLAKSVADLMPAVIDDSLDLFLGNLSTAIEGIIKSNGKLVFVLQRAERVRDVWSEPIMEALYSMAETVRQAV